MNEREREYTEFFKSLSRCVSKERELRAQIETLSSHREHAHFPAPSPELSLQADSKGWDRLLFEAPYGHLAEMDQFWIEVYAKPEEIAGYIRFEWVTDIAGKRVFSARELRSGSGAVPRPEPLLEGASSLLPAGH
jgi:hypothetical protein